jgi:hypothetical protein
MTTTTEAKQLPLSFADYMLSHIAQEVRGDHCADYEGATLWSQ